MSGAGSTGTTTAQVRRPQRRTSDALTKRAWFEAFDAAQFDTAIERDAHAGKLDAHAQEALAAHRAGRSREV